MNKQWSDILFRVAQIALWLLLVVVLGSAAVLAWWFLFDADQSTVSMKWGQFMQTAGAMLLPPILCAVIFDERHRPLNWLHLNKGADWKIILLAVLIMLTALPAINLLADLNSRVVLPECLSGVEQWMKSYEEAAEKLMADFLKTDHIDTLFINIGLIAVLPALCEELTFRGTLQQLLGGSQWNRSWKMHAAIWVTAFIFSAIHMQFYGFVPRMLMGAMFGYMFVWTGSLWIPILMHFTNNGLVVIAYYLFEETALEGKSYADTFGAGTTWWVGVLSLIAVGVLLWIVRRIARKE